MTDENDDTLVPEEDGLPEEIDSYMQMLEELDLYVLKLTTKEEIVGVFEDEDEYSISLVMPLSLLPTYYMIDRWRPPEMDEYIDGEDEVPADMTEEDYEPEDAIQSQMSDLYGEKQIQPPIWGRDDFEFQQKQHRILFANANSQRVIPFYHMIEWFQHTNDSIVEVNKMTIVSKAPASFDLKHEYMSFFSDRAKEHEFESEQQEPKPKNEEPEINIEEPHFGTLKLKMSQFSSYQSKAIH